MSADRSGVVDNLFFWCCQICGEEGGEERKKRKMSGETEEKKIWRGVNHHFSQWHFLGGRVEEEKRLFGKLTVSFFLDIIFFSRASLEESACRVGTQPPTVVRKMEAQSECIQVAYTFLQVWHRLVCSVGAY